MYRVCCWPENHGCPVVFRVNGEHYLFIGSFVSCVGYGICGSGYRADYDVVAFYPAVSLFLVCLGLCHIEAYRIVSLEGCSVYAEPCRFIYHAAGGDLGKRGFTPFTDDGSAGES